MKCFYHNDADGKCAGFWVALSAGITDLGMGYEPTLIEMSYEQKFPMESIRENEQIYIVDYSISPDEMRELLKITSDVTWIDHHKTAIEKYTGFEFEIRGVRYDGIAGCMLTYCYLHHMTARGEGDIKPFDLSMTEDAPMFTKLIADWDVWRFEYGDDTRYFITAFNAYNLNPESEGFHRLIFDGKEKEFIAEGKVMKKFRDGWAAEEGAGSSSVCRGSWHRR
jgi:oligoribonuclease NrnB/cAMP/cGMP phosphodiesterase (DHH superfamily)